MSYSGDGPLARQWMALAGFSLLLERTLGYRVPLAYKGMKRFIYEELNSVAGPWREEVDGLSFREQLREAFAEFRHKADSVAVLTASESRAMGIGSCDCVLFIEAEHSSFLTHSVLIQYARLWVGLDEYYITNCLDLSVAILGRYGEPHYIRLKDIGDMCVLYDEQLSDRPHKHPSYAGTYLTFPWRPVFKGFADRAAHNPSPGAGGPPPCP